jgi:VIT1/CCC1 family predicted Fe2+/Mn2+ transporter
MGRRDAEAVVAKMAQYENFFVGLMVSEDLGMQLSDDNDASFLTDAFLMFASYACFGAIPILIFCLGSVGIASSRVLYLVSAGCSLAVLCLLGVVKSSFSGSSWVSAAVEALVVGVACSSVSYLLGYQLIAFFMG